MMQRNRCNAVNVRVGLNPEVTLSAIMSALASCGHNATSRPSRPIASDLRLFHPSAGRATITTGLSAHPGGHHETSP